MTHLILFPRLGEYLRCILERAGLWEVALDTARTEGAKQKVLVGVLEVLQEARGGVGRMVRREGEEQGEDEEEGEREEGKMLETLVQRIQFILLSLIKIDTTKKGKSKRPDNLKDLYAVALKCSGKSGNLGQEVLELLDRVAERQT